jgi:alkanesulfonate monooxygenase SsuD/methylene tetrahydromethanopterin reductase-like flavin-dependent oxidoreductase (luciferase family)
VSRAFAPGSVSLGLHTIERRDGAGQAEALVEQAVAAEAAGFDGVTLSEHHGAFPGYMGQPLLAATWLLSQTERIWAGPAPYLLGLRNPILVAEELAWTAARFPGRVGAAFASGYARADFELLGIDFESRATHFAAALDTLLETLRGTPRPGDPAIDAWAADPGPILCAGNSRPGVRRAALTGTGLLLPGGNSRERYRELIALYRETAPSGPPGPVVKIRQIWIGSPPPGALEARDAVYRQAATAQMRQAAGFAEPFLYGSDEHVLEELARDAEEFGLDAMNIRFHLADVSHEAVLEQIAHFGEAVLPRLSFPAAELQLTRPARSAGDASQS